jgi:hypothetical protein
MADSASTWRLCTDILPCIGKSVSWLFIEKRESSGAREVNATPLDISEVGKEVNMPPEAAEWRFNIKRDIIVTLMLWAVGLHYDMMGNTGCGRTSWQMMLSSLWARAVETIMSWKFTQVQDRVH